MSNIANTITKLLSPVPDPWPQVVEQGFAALVTMVQAWDSLAPDESKEHEKAVWQLAICIQDSEDDDVREETEESIEVVEEGDIDDETQDIELGSLDEVDTKQLVISLMQKHFVLLQAHSLPENLIERIAETFPEYEQMFHSQRHPSC